MGRAVNDDANGLPAAVPPTGGGLWAGRMVHHRLEMRGGKLRMQRLGHLNAVRQDFNGSFCAERAPVRRGIWAFPWPCFDLYFAHHKYWEAMPKRLWYETPLTEMEERYEQLTKVITEPAQLYQLQQEYRRLRDEMSSDLYEQRMRWIRRVGRKQIPLRQFWFDGELFSHLNLHGEFVGTDDWTRMPVRRFYELVRKWERRAGTPSEVYEVFIPRNELGGR